MSVVFTVGYEGTDIDRFVGTLQAVGIKRLADVRALALSRKKGFSKTKLSERLSEVGIEYKHYRKLGDPKPGREAARAGKYEEFRRIYNTHLMEEESKESLRELSEDVQEKATCLLCFERNPLECHRTIITKELVGLLGIEVFDLYADNPMRYVKHASSIPRFHSRESAAAA